MAKADSQLDTQQHRPTKQSAFSNVVIIVNKFESILASVARVCQHGSPPWVEDEEAVAFGSPWERAEKSRVSDPKPSTPEVFNGYRRANVLKHDAEKISEGIDIWTRPIVN